MRLILASGSQPDMGRLAARRPNHFITTVSLALAIRRQPAPRGQLPRFGQISAVVLASISHCRDGPLGLDLRLLGIVVLVVDGRHVLGDLRPPLSQERVELEQVLLDVVVRPELSIGLSPAFLRPNKANKAKISSVSECLNSGVSLVWGGETRLTRLNSGVGILKQFVGGWGTRLNNCGRHAGKI